MSQYWQAMRSVGGKPINVGPLVGRSGPGWRDPKPDHDRPWAVAPASAIGDAIATKDDGKIAAAIERWADEMKRGAQGCPLVPSQHFPGELTLSCDSCGSTALTGTVEYPGRGSGPGGRGRLGDAGSRDVTICRDCGRRHYDP